MPFQNWKLVLISNHICLISLLILKYLWECTTELINTEYKQISLSWSRDSPKLVSTCRYTYIWRRKWQPTPVSLPGESHGQRILVGHGVAKCWKWLSDEAHTYKHIHIFGMTIKFKRIGEEQIWSENSEIHYFLESEE